MADLRSAACPLGPLGPSPQSCYLSCRGSARTVAWGYLALDAGLTLPFLNFEVPISPLLRLPQKHPAWLHGLSNVHLDEALRNSVFPLNVSVPEGRPQSKKKKKKAKKASSTSAFSMSSVTKSPAPLSSRTTFLFHCQCTYRSFGFIKSFPAHSSNGCILLLGGKYSPPSVCLLTV